MGLSYIAFIMLRYVPSIPAFWRVFIINGCWILSKAFSASIEVIVWFLSLNLLMWCITLIDLRILKNKNQYDHVNDAEKAFDKIQYPFMIKTLQKVGTEGTYLNITKAIYDKSTAKIILNGKCFQFFTIEENVCCEFIIYGFYYVKICSFYAHFLEGFYHKWVLNFVKVFLCIYWDNLMVFIFQFVNVGISHWLICECWRILASLG